MKKTNSSDYWWPVHCIVCIMLALSAAGCSALGGFLSNDSPEPANEWDSVIATAEAEATIACFEAEEAAAKTAMGKLTSETAVLASQAIQGLTIAAGGGSKCGSRKNLYDAHIVMINAGVDKHKATMDATKSLGKDIVFGLIGWKSLDTMGEIAMGAGRTTFGDGATVSGSFNSTKATNLGEGMAQATGTAEPTVVDPVIVEPVIVQ